MQVFKLLTCKLLVADLHLPARTYLSLDFLSSRWNPCSRRRLLLVQRDVTAQVEMESRMSQLVQVAQANVRMMGQMMPRRAIEMMAGLQAPTHDADNEAAKKLSSLAQQHKGVGVLVVKLLGEDTFAYSFGCCV